MTSDFKLGYLAASEDLLDPKYDLLEALASFRRDPADCASQEGYLTRLEEESDKREAAWAHAKWMADWRARQ
jgi:hypothetical protein